MEFDELKEHLRRTDWGDFPDVAILADVPTAKGHPLYASGKAGDAKAAEALVTDVLATSSIEPLRAILGSSKPYILPVHAVETAGMNAIPRVFGRLLAEQLELPITGGVIQINRVMHTGADGYHRLAFPALFEGAVEPGTPYLIVDDFACRQ